MTAPLDQQGLTMEAVERQTLVVRWRLSGAALRRARADLQLGERDVSLGVHVDLLREDEGWRPVSARAELEAADGRTCRIEGTTGMGACVIDAGLLHLDVPGLISATIHAGDERRLVYARTPLLESLGMAPGTYEPVGCATS